MVPSVPTMGLASYLDAVRAEKPFWPNATFGFKCQQLLLFLLRWWTGWSPFLALVLPEDRCSAQAGKSWQQSPIQPVLLPLTVTRSTSKSQGKPILLVIREIVNNCFLATLSTPYLHQVLL